MVMCSAARFIVVLISVSLSLKRAPVFFFSFPTRKNSAIFLLDCASLPENRFNPEVEVILVTPLRVSFSVIADEEFFCMSHRILITI